MECVATLIAAPGDPVLSSYDAGFRDLRKALEAAGAETGPPVVLSSGEAMDLPIWELAPDLAGAVILKTLGDQPVDVLVQPVANRRKRLLVADMDSTIVTGETLDDLAAHAGLKDKIAAITARAMNGELDFEAALRERVGMLKGLPLTAVSETLQEVALTPGAKTAIQTLAADGCHCLLVSGGFTLFTEEIARQCGFHGNKANQLGLDDNALSGEVIPPIVTKDTKLETLMTEAGRLGLSMDQTAAIGDGANDLPMIKAAALGVAWRAKPVVRAEARFALDHGDLTGLLFAMGYPRDAFAA
ncbi:MAG: phosphoserine phosphatase SerB [Rhodospirillaceae bacterium]